MQSTLYSITTPLGLHVCISIVESFSASLLDINEHAQERKKNSEQVFLQRGHMYAFQ